GVAVRLGVILAPLGAADELRERVVHDGDARRHGMRVEEQSLVSVDNPGDPPGRYGAVGDRAVEIDQTVTARFIAGGHRVVRIDIYRARARGDRRPRPETLVCRGHGIAVQQRDISLAALHLPDIPALVRAVAAAL